MLIPVVRGIFGGKLINNTLKHLSIAQICDVHFDHSLLTLVQVYQSKGAFVIDTARGVLSKIAHSLT